MLVICVVFSTTGIINPEAPLLRAASNMAPTAPMEAASVGVAMPPRIDPSTATISSDRREQRFEPVCRDCRPRGASGMPAAGRLFGRKHRHRDQDTAR